MKKLTNVSEYKEIVERYGKKGVLSNDFLAHTASNLIDNEALYAICNKSNAFLFVKKEVGMRMYYYINDLKEDVDLSSHRDIVVEILFRNELPQVELGYLSKNGFQLNLVRDQYAGIYRDLAMNVHLVPRVRLETAQSLQDIEKACELFNESFDRLSGDYIPENQYDTLLREERILIARDTVNSEFLGALHQEKEGAVNVIGHLAVLPKAQGHGVGKALLDAFVERNKNLENPDKTRYQLWVQQRNKPAVEMYRNKGFKFTNKSTISLIK